MPRADNGKNYMSDHAKSLARDKARTAYLAQPEEGVFDRLKKAVGWKSYNDNTGVGGASGKAKQTKSGNIGTKY